MIRHAPWPRPIPAKKFVDWSDFKDRAPAQINTSLITPMSTYSNLKAEYEELLDKITEIEREAAEERDNDNESQADALDKHADRLQGLANIVKQKLLETSPAGVSVTELEHCHLTSRISRELRDCKIEVVCSRLSNAIPPPTKVDEARQDHINTLETLLQKLTR